MCIIVYKPAGEVCPSWKTLKTCYNNNPDGCGFMYAENDAVHIRKGFMSWRSFKTAFKPFKNREDLPITLHFRITTNGGTNPQNTHPFPLTEKVGELKALNLDCEVGIAHNGIISLTAYAEKMSDTMEFIRKYGSCIINSPTWYYNRNSNKLLAEVIKSKMLVLSKDGHGEIVGDGWTHDDGIWYSNTTFKPWSWKSNKRGSYTYSGWDSLYDSWINDDPFAPSYCKYWEGDYPKLQCIECSDNKFCWSEEELYEIGAII